MHHVQIKPNICILYDVDMGDLFQHQTNSLPRSSETEKENTPSVKNFSSSVSFYAVVRMFTAKLSITEQKRSTP